MPSAPVVLAILVTFVAVPVNWFVVIALGRLLRARPDNGILRDRFLVAAMLATVVTIFAAVFVNNDMTPPPFGLPVTQVFTRLSILSLAIPAIYWLSLYWRRPQ